LLAGKQAVGCVSCTTQDDTILIGYDNRTNSTTAANIAFRAHIALVNTHWSLLNTNRDLQNC